MAISIFLAKTARHIDDAFRLRYDVYVDEERRFPPKPDQRVYDRFDAFPQTKIIVAVDRAQPQLGAVGTMRFAVKGEVGLPSDHFYDFSKVLEGLEGKVATLGMLAVRRRYRLTRGLVTNMVLVAWRELRAMDAQHLVAPASPDAEQILLGMGAKPVGESFGYGDPPVKMTPLYLDMMNLRPMFREISVDPQHILIEDIDERRLYRQGQRVMSEGQIGHEAFLIMRGSVRVQSGRSGAKAMYLLGPGEMFGELALLDGGEHPMSVDVHSKLLDVAVIPREQFQAHLASDRAFAQRVLKLLAERIRRLLVDLPPTKMAQVNQEALLAEILLDVSERGKKPVEIRWLAAECGMKESALEEVLVSWYEAGVVRRQGEGPLEVSDPGMLEAIVDHLVEAYALYEQSGRKITVDLPSPPEGKQDELST